MEEWLSGQDTYTLHKSALKSFPRNPYSVTNIDDVWEMVLAVISSLSRYDKQKYLLNGIDIFSRYAWKVPLKDKTSTSITGALFQNRKPITIQSDKGTEFVNAIVQQYLKRQGLDFHTTLNPDIKCAIFERFNGTLNTKIYKYVTKNKTYRYVDVINKLLTSYNNSVKSTKGMSPSKVNAATFTPSGLKSPNDALNVKWEIL